MKKILTLLLLVILSSSLFGQISNTKVVRIANASTVFSQPLSEGNILIDLNTDNCYLILKAVSGTKTISALTANVDYEDLSNSTATDSTFVWVKVDTLFVEGNIAAVDSAHGVKINSNFTVESDGTLRVDGSATTWDDLRVPLSSANKKNSTAVIRGIPFSANQTSGTPQIDWFAPSGTDEMYFVAQLPHSWNEGTIIYPHIHWIPSENGAAGPTLPRWGLEYAWLNIGDTFSSYTTIYGTTTSTSEVLEENKQYLTPLGAAGIDGTNKQISSMLICRIFRDGSDTADTFAGYAGALEVDFHYEINTMGSRQEFIK